MMKKAEFLQEELNRAAGIRVPLSFIRAVQADALKCTADSIILDRGFNAQDFASYMFDILWTEALQLDPTLAIKYQNKC